MNRRIYICFLLVIWFTQSCSFDDDLDVLDQSAEDFQNITPELLNTIDSPYAEQLAQVRNGDNFFLADIIREIIAIFPGSVLVDLDDSQLRGIRAWRIKLKLSNQARLIFYVSKEQGTIFRIDGTNGPYTYALEAGPNFISLNEAFQAALNVEGGTVQYWRLDLDDALNWLFFVFIQNQDGIWEIRVDAQNGGVFGTLLESSPFPNDSDTSLDDIVVPDVILDRTLAMSTGQIFHADVNPSSVLEAFLETNSGALIKFRYFQSDLSLTQIAGEEAPFDYEILPENDLIPFSEVTDSLSKISQASISEWSLERDDSFGSRWIYKFDLLENEQLKRIYFDALSKEIVLNEG